MTARLARYLTHPQVGIDPHQPVSHWHLNAQGQARVAALARSGALRGTSRVISSAETKAVETATPLAEALECPVEVRPAMHENDRSSTGFLPPDAFEAMANRFFATPHHSVEGWERAIDAQARILREVEASLAQAGRGDVLFVGHGAVGTLLWCALSGAAIDRRHDQPGGGGCWFAFDTATRAPLSAWQPLETLIT